MIALAAAITALAFAGVAFSLGRPGLPFTAPGPEDAEETFSRLAHERGWSDVATLGVDSELLNELARVEDLANSRGRRSIKQRMFRWRL